MTETAGTLYREGRLDEAVAAATAAVKATPADYGTRALLAELLLLAGNLERADVILDAAGTLDPGATVAVAEFRQLLRADLARRQLRRDGRLPEFLGEPTPALRRMLEAHVAWRAGDAAGAAQAAAEAEALRPHVGGRHDGTAFDDFRDACDLSAGYFEVLTTTGKYFWIPTERVESIVFDPPTRPRDIAWRRASMSVREGPDGVVYLPLCYSADPAGLSAAQKLGRETDWVEEAGLTRGLGQRLFLAGETALGMLEAGTLEFDG